MLNFAIDGLIHYVVSWHFLATIRLEIYNIEFLLIDVDQCVIVEYKQCTYLRGLILFGLKDFFESRLFCAVEVPPENFSVVTILLNDDQTSDRCFCLPRLLNDYGVFCHIHLIEEVLAVDGAIRFLLSLDLIVTRPFETLVCIILLNKVLGWVDSVSFGLTFHDYSRLIRSDKRSNVYLRVSASVCSMRQPLPMFISTSVAVSCYPIANNESRPNGRIFENMILY